MAAFERAPHYLLDTRLMMAWAKALDEAGDVERARHLAQRLREFRNAAGRRVLRALRRAAAAVRPRRRSSARRRRARCDWRDFR